MQKSKKKAVRKVVKSKSVRARRLAVATVLVLRTCSANMVSHKGFRWPQKGAVKAPDWRPVAECGNGLHGLLWGEGEGAHLDYSLTAKWLVVEVPAKSIVDLKGKVKFPAGKVVYCGTRLGATSFIAAKRPGAAICGGTATAGDRGTATAGSYGTATAGSYGTATAGYRGTATAGDAGTATAGDRGTATAGSYGRLELLYWDDKASRCRKALAYVGEGGIKPNTKYKLNGSAFVEVKP